MAYLSRYVSLVISRFCAVQDDRRGIYVVAVVWRDVQMYSIVGPRVNIEISVAGLGFGGVLDRPWTVRIWILDALEKTGALRPFEFLKLFRDF
jgi:hypothetical protein